MGAGTRWIFGLLIAFGGLAVAIYASMSLSDVLHGFFRDPESEVVTREGASVLLFDDSLHPIEGASIQISNGIREARLMTDGHGQTPWMEMGSDFDVQLIVNDSVVADGFGLGFSCEIEAGDINTLGYFAHFWRIAVTQPTARKVTIKSDPASFQNLFPAELAFPHWRVGVPSGGELDFNLHMAPLMDDEAIAGYLAYRGRVQVEERYIKGLALVVPNVDLGEAGIVIGIDLLDPAIEAVAVDSFQFPTSFGKANAPSAASFECRLLFVDAGVVYVRLSGFVPAGHLGLFARSDSADKAGMRWIADVPQQAEDSPNSGDLPSKSKVTSSDVTNSNSEKFDSQSELREFEHVTSAELFDQDGEVVECCNPELPEILDSWGSTAKVPSFLVGADRATVIREERFTVKASTPIYCRAIKQNESTVHKLSEKFKLIYAVAGEFDLMQEPIRSRSGFVYGFEGSHWQSNTFHGNGVQEICTRDYVVFRNRVFVSSLRVNTMAPADNEFGIDLEFGQGEIEIGSISSKIRRRSGICQLR